MDKLEITKKFSKTEDKLLISKICDKMKFMHTKNQVQVTDFLDAYEQNIVLKLLQYCQENQAYLYGGFDAADRKSLFLIPAKLQEIFEKDCVNNKIINENIKVISIKLPQDLQGTYKHSEYLGGVMKLGLKREKIGDIIVNEEGADILVKSEVASYLNVNLKDLTRFQKAEVKIKEISELIILPTKKEEVIILIPQMRLDVVISEILHLSRNKANEIIAQERVYINYELKTKNATTLKCGDILTIRGKGKYEIGQIISQTAKGKLRLNVMKYVS